ncbi:M48 family metalloprotease [Candidatus Sumerlaeota bacterium]|nr:M48 family metalloprotease [Candidatus Sumerlaeota bacterium]
MDAKLDHDSRPVFFGRSSRAWLAGGSRGFAAIGALLPRLMLPVSLCLTLLLGSGCLLLDDVLTSFTMSPEAEVEFGRKVQAEIEKDLILVRDPAVLDYIASIGEIVIANSPRPALVPTEFFVVHDDEINAFAIPGGNIYVHTGLIYAAQDEAELASVLAHEYGHVVYRHSAQHISRVTGIGMIEQIILGQQAEQGAQMIGDLIAQLGIQNYSRQDELEADSIAVPTLYRAGYDPAAMVTFFEKLRERYGDSAGAVTLFASHPATGDRITRVRATIGALPPREGLLRPLNNLLRIQARLQQLGLAGP